MKKTLYIIAFIFISIHLFAQPANDDCSNAIPINISSGNYDVGVFTSTTIDITDGTFQIGEIFHNVQVSAGNDKKTVWFSFTLPTARAIRLELLQPTENIAQNGVGFTLYKTNTCFPDLDDITAAKLTPLNKFGSSYNPCLLPGEYLIQVSAKQDSDGDIYIDLTTAFPDVLNDFFTQATAYDFGTISNGWHRQEFDAGCQIIESATETCTDLGADHLDYTQTAWFTFTTDADVDLVSLRIGEQSGFFTGNLKVGYNIYEGDVTTNDYSTLSVFDGCQIFEQTVSNIIPVRNYLCEFSPNTTYSIQVFFHNEYTNSVFIELLERGAGATVSPDPSNIQVVSELGILPSSSTGVWSYGYDQLSCNAMIIDNACGTVNPVSGTLESYTMSTFYTFELDDYMNIRFVTSAYLGKKLYFGDVQTDCNLVPIEEFTSGNIVFNCFEPGVYSMQILGKIDTSQNYINSSYNNIGATANLSLNVITNSISSDFLLDATGKIDTVNVISNVWEPLPDDVTINSSIGRFNCSNTVFPDGVSCGASHNRAMYREIIIGDADGDSFDDEGVLSISGGSYYFSYAFFKGSATDLATAQGMYNWGETFTGLEQYTSCVGLYYSSQKVCVEPGKYTLVSYGDDSDVGRTDNPKFKFNIRETQFFDPLAPNDMGDITAALYSNPVSGTADYFSCNENPLSIASSAPCSGATKQIYRQFYIDESLILNITMSGGSSFRLFYGKISDGLSGLTSNIPGIGDIGCRSSYYTNVCNPLPAGWYTIVTYGIGANYNGPTYSGGVIGNQTNINIARVAPLTSTLHHLPYISYDAGITDWGPNAGSSAIPENSQTYTFGSETFNCINNSPLLIEDCTGNNRQAFYVFEITKESYLSFSDIPTTMKAQLYEGDVRIDSASFAGYTPIQECINIININHYDRSWWLWSGKVDLCKMQPGVYTLIIFANDAHVNQTVTPVLYVDNVEESRFDFANNAYDFDLIQDNNTFQYGKVGDVNPLDAGRAASNDFFYCTTGALESDPGQDDAISYCWDGQFPTASQPSVDYPMGNNSPQYASSTNVPIRKNLWYTFVVDGPGLITVKVENKTPNKTLQNPFAIYKSDVDGTLDFASVVAGGDVDSTISQGLTFIDNNSTFGWYGCAGNQESISFNIDPCDSPGKQRFYVLVDQHVGIIPNHQIEVSIKHDAIISLDSNYDYFVEANLINGLNEIDPPYTSVELTDGTYHGDTSSYACATIASTDQNTCGTRTLWYKFTSSVDGKLRILYEIDGLGSYYNSNEMFLFKEIIAGDSTSTGLELISTSIVNIAGQNWGESCLNAATYYIMLTGCSYTVENVIPHIWLISEDGGNCEQAAAIVLNSLGTDSETVTIDCHDIGASFGEDGSNMGCLQGPEGYKSTWFRVDLNFTERADITFQLSENTTALPSQIRYRVLYGTCNSMTAGPCNTDALTEFTLNCMMSENSSYFVQVIMPESVTGDITLSVTTTESPNQLCVPFDPLTPTANFIYENTCEGDLTCFTNYSTLGDSITYDWTFDLDDPSSDTSTDLEPCYTFASNGVYTVQLIVTNVETGSADTVEVAVTIYLKPDPAITRNPATYDVVSGVPIDFYSNVTDTIVAPPTIYSWDMNNGDYPSISDPLAITYGAANLGLNTVYITVTNGTCVVVDSNEVMVGFEPIYTGGNYDGSSFNFIECIPENIFTGGNYDGSSFNIQECIPQIIFAGGFYDGSSMEIQECAELAMFAGGFYDGSSVSSQVCIPESIFAGGFYDGAASVVFTGDIDYTVTNYSICSGSNVEIAIAEITPIDSVRWYNGTTLISTITTAPFDLSETLTSSTTISDTVYFSGTVCNSISSFDIEVVTPEVADAGSDFTICIGEEVQIGTVDSGTANYEWSPTASLDDHFLAQPIASPSSTTIYTVSVNDAASVCPEDTDFMTVTVNTDIPVIGTTDQQICSGGNTDITVTGGEAGDTYDWYTSSTPNIGTTATINVSATDTYYIEVTRGTCTVLDSAIVSLLVPSTDELAWRSKNNGDWNDVNTWQIYNGSAWVDASTHADVCGNGVDYPTYLDSTILIVSPHTVTYNLADESIDELSIESGATVNINAGMIFRMVDLSSSAIVPDILNDGRIAIDNTASLIGEGDAILQNNGRINIAGDFVVDAAPTPKLINSNTSTVAYTNLNQNIWNGSFGRLEILGGGLKSVTGTSTYINTEVEFFAGYIQLGFRNITLAQAAIVTNASFATGYFITDNSGAIIKEGLGGLGYESFIYPVGHSTTSFNKALITNSGTSDNIRCRVVGNFDFEASFPNDELLEETSVDRTWYLSEEVIGGSDISMELFWIPTHENPSFSNSDCQIGEYTSATGWERIGTSGAAAGAGNYPDMHSYSTSGLTELNAYSAGSCLIPVLVYRTIANGDWTDISIWEVLDETGTNWVSPLYYPSVCGEVTYPTSYVEEVAVRHKVVYDYSIPEGIDQTTIEASGTLSVPEGINMHIANGSGDDIINHAEITITGTASSENGFTVMSNPNSIFHYNGANQDLLECTYARLLINGDLPDAERIKTVVGNNTIVTESLNFINGKILLDFNLTLTVNASIENSSATTGYCVATGNAYLIWEYPAGNSISRNFPVGGVYYSPASINFSQITVPGTMMCRVRESVHPNNSNTIKRYWTFEKGTIGFASTYNMTLYYDENDLPYIPANTTEEMSMVELAGAYNLTYPTADNWIYSDSGIDYYVSVTANMAQLTHNQFSDFSLLAKNNPLPVTTLYITAEWDKNDALIKWATGSEINNYGFEIQRCTGGCSEFETIGFVRGNGNSSTAKFYSFVDLDAKTMFENNFYYRLKQIDFDNEYSYTHVVTLNKDDIEEIAIESSILSIYPNPAKVSQEIYVVIEVEADQEILLMAYDIIGKEIFRDKIFVTKGTNVYTLKTNNFTEGTYVLRVIYSNKSDNKKFVISTE